MKTQLENLRTKFTGSDLRREVTALISKMAGPDNRFKRQALYRELTGENILVAQAGINRLIDTAMKYLATEQEAEQEAEQESGKVVYMADETEETPTAGASEKPESLELTVELGLLVIRKACKRSGVVHAVDGDKITVLLADGSKRKPNRERFLKLYQRQ